MAEPFEGYLQSHPGAALPAPFDPNLDIYVARDFETALAFAETLAAEHGFDMFRGQRRGWRLDPSLFRDGVDRQDAIAKISHLANWIGATPELASMHGDADATTAIAQHYGAPTWFIDFSRSPRIAGEFATTGPSGGEIGERLNDDYSVLVCGRRAFIEEAWAEDNAAQIETDGLPMVRVVEIDVRNLWRLQAQQGLFLMSRVDSSEHARQTGLVRIFFPRIEPPRAPSVAVYPEEKSHLELLLDQFMAHEWGWRVGRELFRAGLADAEATPIGAGRTLYTSPGGGAFIGSEETLGAVGYAGVAPAADENVPEPHPSWAPDRLAPWLAEPDERLADAVRNLTLTLRVDCLGDPAEAASTLRSELVIWMAGNPAARATALRIEAEPKEPVDLSGDSDLQRGAYADRAETARYLWDGLRRTPFSDREVAAAIANYLVIVMSRAEGDLYATVLALYGGHVLGVEGSSAGGRMRGFAPPDLVEAALREELQGSDARAALAACRYPNRLFRFDAFADLYARAFLPTAAYLKTAGPELLFNPARLDVFGLS